MKNPAWLNDVCTLENVAKPESLLLLSDCGWDLDATFSCANIETARPGDILKLPSERVWDLVIAINTLEYLEKREAGYVLAALRDRISKRFAVLVPLDSAAPEHLSQWQETDLLAMGMVRMAFYKNDEGQLGLYHYNIQSYKTTPKWFNNKNWAHPEKWKP